MSLAVQMSDSSVASSKSTICSGVKMTTARLTSVCTLIIYLCVTSSSPSAALPSFVKLSLDPLPANVTVVNVTQKVDHFAFDSSATFDQRVVISLDHWGKDGSPIFFYTGNEGDIFMFANNTGFVWEFAESFGAMVVFAEHRYYGTSLPFGDDSFSSSSKTKYLTVEQALEDFASNIEWIKCNYNAHSSPVIAFGGSYGGMLAAWLRMKYPHLVEGALAASAPVAQLYGIYDCNKFNDIVTQDFRDYSSDCVKVIQLSWPALRRVANESNGIEFINQAFHLCPNEQFDLETLINLLANVLTNMAMTDYPNSATFLSPMPPFPVRETCKQLTDASIDDRGLVVQLANAVNSVYFNYSGSAKCLSLVPDEMDRGWNIQSCAEMVLPTCSDGVNHLFERQEFNLTEYRENCRVKQGLIPDETYIARVFGGKNIQTASNIIFSNGMRDPWSAGSILDPVNDAITVIKIPHACHHEDLRFKGPNDYSELIQAREKEVKVIRRWIRFFMARKNII